MSAKNADCKASILYSSSYVDGSKNSSSISSANGYRYALLVVTGMFTNTLDTLRMLVNSSDDNSFSTTLQDVTLAPGIAGVSGTKTFLLDKSLLKKNIRVRLVGAGSTSPDTRPAAVVTCFEFDSKSQQAIVVDYSNP